MYRAITLKAINYKIDLENEEELSRLLEKTTIELLPGAESQLILLDGEDVTTHIRSTNVTNSVSIVARHPSIRLEMVKRQQRFAEAGGVVMDGRDIGTHVLPNAEVKVFLLASVEERAKRRHAENISKGYPSDIKKLQEEIALRDKMDTEREAAPLKKAKDAVEIDTTSLCINEVVQKILDLAEERIRSI